MTVIDLKTRQRMIDADAGEVAARQTKVQALTKREEDALDAHAVGMSYSSIAVRLGVKTPAAAYKIVMRALERRAGMVTHEGANLARARMLHQTDLMLSRYMPLALAGDDKAAKVVDDQLKRVERLLGLAAPKRVDHHHEIDVQTVEERRQGIVAALQEFANRTIEGEVVEP